MADNNKSSERPFLDNSDFTYRLQDIASRYWPAALAATLGSGLIGGGLAWKTKPLNETPAQRRKRILKAALLPMLGVGAGSAALMGAGAALNMTSLGHNLNTPEGRKARLKEIGDERFNTRVADTLNYGATAGAGIAGGVLGARLPAVADKALSSYKPDTNSTTNRLLTPVEKQPTMKVTKAQKAKVRGARKLMALPYLNQIISYLVKRKAPVASGVVTGVGTGYTASYFHPNRSAEYKDLDRQEAEIRNMQ